ncbi:hypothetical protein BFW01_g2968 [Lasiodiplodia theobromae]|uniref:Transmembrane protein 135 N-terminal domain-containing protein n=1 Tax=Lasiodiplodia theobromae TaxID=45133 RepID=A0A5N5CU47_9PEZI|nr:uncharacterized protein LTHEOB_4006 [Lasiodiplodia theobromae]KAB2568880.1 hypothetical protein DBV05_g12441 [Lasiodiplodia theobromae]KAF4546698.1 hypothetical protein LTHEOB_4006 [Lasiodiplodia theobromae]KAF9632106.1 hypothetical protein BFW01_g2968 [Lasiodiplodia theobromae]
MSSVASSSPSSGKPDKLDPVVRNALRYTLSAREYKLLHQYLISRAPPAARQRAPPPRRYEAIVKATDDYNAAAVRASLRLGLSSYAALKLWEIVSTRFLSKRTTVRPKLPFWKSPNVRLSSSLGLILFFHRILHRFFIRLRESILTDNAKPFRRRNPRVTKVLTSRLAPAIGASLSGFWLGLYPADQLRITIAIYVFSRSLEFIYNGLEDRGLFKDRPWWFGSWLLYPVACGQLLHAFVFDRDCFPEAYGRFILRNSPQYIQPKPPYYAGQAPWPDTYAVVDSLAEIARLRWPPFVSPIMFPNKQTLPRTLTAISPITSPAHPAIKNLSCALLHPHDPSCARTYISYFIQAFPALARFFTIIFGVLSLARYKAFVDAPFAALNRLAKSILRMSLFVTGAIGTSWASICFFQQYLPRNFLPTQRFFLGGFLGGLWAFLERHNGRTTFLYSSRLSIDSFWKVGIKRGWWRGVKNGDVLLFVTSLAVINSMYQMDPKSVNGGVVRKGLSMLRGDGWVDRALLNEKRAKRGKRDEVLDEREVKATGMPERGALSQQDEEEIRQKGA